MSLTITLNDPTRDEALRVADFLYEFAGYGKTTHRFEPNAARQSEILKQHIEDLAAGGDEGELLDPPEEPAAPEAPAAPALDSAGYPWDERIHSSSQALNKDGTWRLRKGVDLVLVTQVRKDARAMGVEVPVAVGVSPATDDEMLGDRLALAGVKIGDVTIGVEHAVQVPPAPQATAPFPPDAKTAAEILAAGSAQTITFPQLMQRVTAMCAAKTMTIERVLDAAKAEGVDSIPLLATTHADKVGAVAARLGVTL